MTDYGLTKQMFFLITFIFYSALSSQTVDSLTPSSDQEILLHTYVESSEIPLNRTVTLHIELSWPGKLNRYQIEPISQPILTNLLMEGSGSENRLITQEDGSFKAIKAITYRLRPLEMGMAYVDGIMIRYTDRESGEEETLTSQRIMIEVIEPIPEGDSGRLQAVVYIVLLAIFFAIVVYFIFLFLRKRRQSRISEVPTRSLPEIYLERLSREVDPRGTNLEEMTNRLYRIFKEYMDQDLDIPARELSTSEILEKLKAADLADDDKENLKQVLQKLDVIRFAGKSVDPNEFMIVYGTIENFLLQRKELRAYQVKEAL